VEFWNVSMTPMRVGFMGTSDVSGTADPHQEVGMGCEEAVPSGEEAKTVFVGIGADAEREDFCSGREVASGVG
jgi:hypothetical protein